MLSEAARRAQQLRMRPCPASRPGLGVEQIECGAGGRQQLIQAHEAAKRASGERLGIVHAIHRGQPADDRVGRAQRLHGRNRAAVRGADADQPRDALGPGSSAIVCQRGARQQRTHAVADQRQLLGTIGGQPQHQRVARGEHIAAPVIVV